MDIFTARLARSLDVPAIKVIADAHRNEVGFVMRPTLELAATHDRLLVVENNAGLIVGFCNYRHCKRFPGRTTVYEIAAAFYRQGIGQLLITSLLQEAKAHQQIYIYLKCVQGLASNDFYRKMGFSLVGVETGKKRPLNVWKRDVEAVVLC